VKESFVAKQSLKKKRIRELRDRPHAANVYSR
jgi:hypothetical protein